MYETWAANSESHLQPSSALCKLSDLKVIEIFSITFTIRREPIEVALLIS
jgi:hypothetical protein